MSETQATDTIQVGFADESPRDLQMVELAFTPEHLVSMQGLLNHIGIAVAGARRGGVEENTIRDRLTQLFLVSEYAVIAFMGMPDAERSQVSESWIGARLGMIQRDFAHRETRKTLEATVSALMNRPDGEEGASFVFARLTAMEDPYLRLRTLSYFLPRPLEAGESTVGFWPSPIEDGTRPIRISGYDRSVVGLRRNISDMLVLRRLPWIPARQGDEVISGVSWMFAKQENVERMLGESMESLQDKGLSWVGPIDILSPDDLAPGKLAPVTSPGVAVTAAAYALPLRDPFITKFLVEGAYPSVGGFTMPRVAFQNWNGQAS